MKRKVFILVLLAVLVFSSFRIAETSAGSSPTGLLLLEGSEESFQICEIHSNSFYKSRKVVWSPEITLKSFNITNEVETDLEKTSLLYDFVSRNYDYEVFSEWRNSADVYKDNSGDCMDQSILLTALLRSRGLDAYVVEGSGHAWTAVYVNGKWVQLDPTADNILYVEQCLNSNCSDVDIYANPDEMFNEQYSFIC